MAKADFLAMVDAAGYALVTVTFQGGAIVQVQGERQDGSVEPLDGTKLATDLTAPVLNNPRKNWVLVFDVTRRLITQHATDAVAREFRVIEDRMEAARAARLASGGR